MTAAAIKTITGPDFNTRSYGIVPRGDHDSLRRSCMKLERAATLDAWADLVTGLLIERLQRTPTLRMCLPTGLTPVPIYDRLSAAVARRDASLEHATIFCSTNSAV